jgi:acyl-CoA synthetase (AMP-forming)/AMP-acid ligase II/thioesterase domain-containing protein/acyl carrier protein
MAQGPDQPRESLLSELRHLAANFADAPALLDANGLAVSFTDLLASVERIHAKLHALGLSPNSRLAAVLPDSAETALLLLAGMSFCQIAPINPRLPTPEILAALRAVRAEAVLVQESSGHALWESIDAAGLPIIAAITASPLGDADLTAKGPLGEPGKSVREPPGGDSILLVVQTSGTTDHPRVVPLSHNNLLRMMRANCRALELHPTDRCLSIMPLFHIHGLGAVICSLLGGGSVVVMNGFVPDEFFPACEQFRPTWYTAVPSVHQAILAAAPWHASAVSRIASGRMLRFIRSGSAPMPAGVAERLEKCFGTVYIEASGATEASAYLCTNRIRDRRIGSVGRPLDGVELRIIDENAHDVPTGSTGELIARSPGIFSGYEGAPQATSAAFLDGWFRTGDLARQDSDGFYYLTGRLKEQINRAGMKICPRQVDDALLTNPNVSEAATFAIPDPVVGEEVAAAVVLRPGARLTELELQRHCSGMLADFKVPRRIVFVDRLPKNSTGKLQRSRLATLLKLDREAAEPVSPETRASVRPSEQLLQRIWCQILVRGSVPVDVSFQGLGGDSMQAVAMCVEVERMFGRQIPLAALFTHGTIQKLADLLESDGWKGRPGVPVILRKGSGAAIPVFCLPGIGGNVYSYHSFATRIRADVPVIGLPLPGTDGLEPPLRSIPAVAERFWQEIVTMGVPRALRLVGYSFGGRVAFELARVAQRENCPIDLLVLLDTPGPGWPRPLPLPARLGVHARRLWSTPISSWPGYFTSRWARKGQLARPEIARLMHRPTCDTATAVHEELIHACDEAACHYKPRPIDVPITLFRAEQCVWKDSDVSDPSMGWKLLAGGGLKVRTIPGSHGTIFHDANVQALSDAMNRELDALDAGALGHEFSGYRATA